MCPVLSTWCPLKTVIQRTLFVPGSLSRCYYSSKKTMSVADKFKEHEVVPNVVSKPPQQIIDIRYGSNQVNLGNVLTPTQVKEQPTRIHWPAADAKSFYTLIFTDPDVPNRQAPTNGEFQHWLVGNIPGDQVEKGEVLSEYVGSGPPKGSGLHRYVFLVYRQPNGEIKDMQTHINKHTVEGRRKWKAEEFAEKHGLEGPLAGNFYQAEYDDYVPTLHAQFAQASAPK